MKVVASSNIHTTQSNALWQRFCHHLTALSPSASNDLLTKLWHDIYLKYTAPHRVYHSLSHLQNAFLKFDEVVSALEQPNLVALALFYHDVIYLAERSDNEAQSALHAERQLTNLVHTKQIEAIKMLIMMTASHALTSKIGLVNQNDAAYFLDIDLSILGAPWDDYHRYASAVRKEFSHLDDNTYQLGRLSVLQGLLARPRLYFTSAFYESLEQRARSNIEREINTLDA